MRLLKHTVCMTLLTLPIPLLALQSVEVTQGVPATIVSSGTSYNHLKVVGERIKGLKGGLAHQVQLPAQQLGDGSLLYKLKSDKPVQVMVHTEQGQVYTLRLHPSKEEGETILLQPTDVKPKDKMVGEKHIRHLSRLIKALYQGKGMAGYMRRPLEDASLRFKDLEVSPEYQLKGRRLTGEVYLLKNPSTETVPLKEASFYQEGVAAIAIPVNELPPQAYTRLFLIKERTDEER